MRHILAGPMASLIPLLCFLAPDTGGKAGAVADKKAEKPPHDPFAPHPVVDTTTIEIKKLVLDAGTQPRVAIDDSVVKEYTDIIKQAMKDEQPIPFPPITAFRDSTGRVVPADGFHRIAAHKAAHAKEIAVEIREGTEEDAILYSCGANASHGVRRTDKDKRRSVKTILAHEDWAKLSNVDIAKLAGVSEFLVRELRQAAKDSTVREVKRGGKIIKMKVAGIGKKGGTKKKPSKKAAKATAKGGKAADEDKGPKTALQSMTREVSKITAAMGPEGPKILKALEDKSLDWSARDIRDASGLTPESIRKIMPLCIEGPRMKPFKAFEFIKSELPEKVVADLHLRAIGNGGKFEQKGGGFIITVEKTGK